MDPSFYLRLAAALKKPELEFYHLYWDKLPKFILCFWINFSTHENTQIPPLCSLSDALISKIINKVLKPVPEANPESVRKNWERLGLRKLSFYRVKVRDMTALPRVKGTEIQKGVEPARSTAGV